MQAAGVVPSIFSLLPGYDGHFQNPVPPHDARLRKLYSKEMLAGQLDVLVQKANDIMPSPTVSVESAKAVEAMISKHVHSRMFTHCG